MNAGCYVGRIGGLAVALGVGAAVFTGHGIAYAETGSESSPSGTSASGSGTSASDTDTPSAGSSTGAQTSSGSSTGSDSTSKDESASDEADADPKAPPVTKKDRRHLWADLFGGKKPAAEPEADDPDSTPGTPSGGTDETPASGAGDTAGTDKVSQPKKPRWSWKPAETSPATQAEDTNADKVVADKPAKKTSVAMVNVDAPESVPAASKLAAVTTAVDSSDTTTTEIASGASEKSATTVGPVATLFKRFLDVFSGNAPSSPAANSPFAWLVAAASRREIGAAAAESQDPTMYWNGYQIVAAGEPTIRQFYGEFTMVPAFPGIVQGQQDFQLVDPESGKAVANVHGLVTYNNDLGFGNRLMQVLATNVELTEYGQAQGLKIGVEPGDIPPEGSFFGSVSNGRAGTTYSALDVPGGEDVVTYKFVTSRISLPLNPDPFKLKFSSANFLYDNEGINRPIYTKDGYYIKPMSPTTDWLAYAGYQPLFNAIQGVQTFGLYKQDDDSDPTNDELVGTFDGVVTVTSDFWGTTSQAILVTNDHADGDNAGKVGVEAGQIPPEESIYNIIYWTADPREYLLYYAKPAERPGADVFKTLLVDITKRGKERVGELNLKFDAAAPPVRESLDVPGRNGSGYSFVPVGEKVYTGVNGLPPREAITQGAQQFKVYDSNNNYLGSVDALVSSQWDLAGNSSEAILVIDINEVADGKSIGVDKGEVPPVGSVFNFKYQGNSGFGEAYYALPTASGKSKIVRQIVTPFGGIKTFDNYDAAKNLAGYDYVNPFGDDEVNLLSPASAQSGAMLGIHQGLCVLDGVCEADAA